eukprot:393182_1
MPICGDGACQCGDLNLTQTCNLNCIGENICSNDLLICSSDVDCDINCQYDNSCDDAIILGRSSTQINLDCFDGNRSCIDITLIPQLAQNVTITCDGDYGCLDAIFKCGSGVCILNCLSDTACMGISIDITSASSFECIGGTNCDQIGNVITSSPTAAPTTSPNPTQSPTSGA